MRTFNAEDLKVGDVIGIIWVRAYQHGATMRITKVNKKSFKAEEVKGSYGGPIPVGNEFYPKGRKATVWNIHKTANFVYYPNYDECIGNNDMRPLIRLYPDHYDYSR